MTEDQKKEKRILKRQAELLWRLVTTTPGVANLAEPMKRAEYHFERLTQGQRVTVGVIALQLAKGFHEIEKEESERTRQETGQETGQASTAQPPQPRVVAIEPDEVIPPGQDERGDGSASCE